VTANNTPTLTARSREENRKYCNECAHLLRETSVADTTMLPGFGVLHTECTGRCPCGYTWPASLLDTGEVLYYCGGCAIAAGRDDLL